MISSRRAEKQNALRQISLTSLLRYLYKDIYISAERSTMVAIQLEYQGDLHCKAVHGPSGTELATDAPKDNQGRGESFSPTDLVATALGSCMLTVMGIMARTLKIDITGTTATVEKEMATTPVRMIRSLTVKIHVPHQVSEEDRKKLERAAHTCPVHKSLHPDVQKPIEFTWG
jgi:putative redox protein